MFKKLKGITAVIKSKGVVTGINWLITRVFHRAIPHKQVIWFTDLTELDAEGFSMPNNIRIERFYSVDQVDKQDYKTLAECSSDLMGSAAGRLMHERFIKGAVLWLIKVDGRLAGYRWTIANDHRTPTYMPHSNTDVHNIGAELFPGFRGMYVHQLATAFEKMTLRNEGFKRYYAETYLWNKRALKAILKKTSGRKIGIATRFSFFGKNVVVWHDMTENMDFL